MGILIDCLRLLKLKIMSLDKKSRYSKIARISSIVLFSIFTIYGISQLFFPNISFTTGRIYEALLISILMAFISSSIPLLFNIVGNLGTLDLIFNSVTSVDTKFNSNHELVKTDLESISTLITTHNENLIRHTEKLVLELKSINYMLNPEVLYNLLPNSKEHFNKLLDASLNINKLKIESIIGGKFYLSSDTFENYYFNTLLKDELVEYYYSSALITDENYFIKNNIKKLGSNYKEIARGKKGQKGKEVYLLMFIKDEIDKKEFFDMKRILESDKKIDFHLIIHDYQTLVDTKNKKIIKDFGIAGNIAVAELIEYKENEAANKLDDNKIKDKFYIDFQESSHKIMLETFEAQIDYLHSLGKIDVFPKKINKW